MEIAGLDRGFGAVLCQSSEDGRRKRYGLPNH